MTNSHGQRLAETGVKLTILDEVAAMLNQIELGAKWLSGANAVRPCEPPTIYMTRRREFDAAFEMAMKFRRDIAKAYGYTPRFSVSEICEGDDRDRFEISIEARQYSFTASFERVKQAARRGKTVRKNEKGKS